MLEQQCEPLARRAAARARPRRPSRAGPSRRAAARRVERRRARSRQRSRAPVTPTFSPSAEPLGRVRAQVDRARALQHAHPVEHEHVVADEPDVLRSATRASSSCPPRGRRRAPRPPRRPRRRRRGSSRARASSPITPAAGARYGWTSSSGRTGCGTWKRTVPASRSMWIRPPLRRRSSARTSLTCSYGDASLPSSASERERGAVVDGHEQVGRRLDAAEAQAVGAERRVCRRIAQHQDRAVSMLVYWSVVQRIPSGLLWTLSYWHPMEVFR